MTCRYTVGIRFGIQLHWIIGSVIDLDTITSSMVKITWRQVIRAFSKFKEICLCMCFIHLVHAFAKCLVMKTYITRENENFVVAKITWFCNWLYKLYYRLCIIRYVKIIYQFSHLNMSFVFADQKCHSALMCFYLSMNETYRRKIT